MAMLEIHKVFSKITCGKLLVPDGIKKFSHDLKLFESAILKKYSEYDVDAVIIIRLEGLTPRLDVTFSIPFLWNGASEVDFTVKVLSLKNAEVLMQRCIKRTTGGPFHIRPADWASDELYDVNYVIN